MQGKRGDSRGVASAVPAVGARAGRGGWDCALADSAKGVFEFPILERQRRLQRHRPALGPRYTPKHQYDYDVATVYGFLKTYGLENEVKVNIEVGHAFLAGHSFEHELAVARSLGILGLVDANRNDLQSGWDTDQFPNNPGEMALAFYQILKNGGLGNGGFNFDAKIRRQSIDPPDLVHGHVGGLDILARGLKAAASIIEDGTLDAAIAERYAGWSEREAKAMLSGKRSLEQIAARVEKQNLNPKPRSGRQEYLENLINRFV